MALAVALAVVPAWTGIAELALYFTPLLIVGALVVSGRFLGEERAIARIGAARAERPCRAPRVLRRPVPARAAVSLLARRVRVERGPPVALAPAA